MPIADNLKLTAEIVVQGTIAAAGAGVQNTFNIFHYRRNAVVNPIDKGALATEFEGGPLAALVAVLNLTWSVKGITIRMMEDPSDAAEFFADAAPGAIAGDRLSPVITSFLLTRTGLRGKRYQGNKKFGPMSESDTTSGSEDNWNAACLARLATLATAIGANLIDGTPNIWTPCVVSRLYSDFTAVPCVISSADITSVAVRKSPGRLKGRAVAPVY